jgi:hypothetical protein
VKKPHVEPTRTITAAEVRGWFGASSNALLSEVQYSEIAAYLTKCRWPSDPPPSPDAPGLSKIIESGSDDYWDFKAVTDAAKTLRDSVPAMLSHWEGLRWAPETREGYEVIKGLGEALSAAMPYVEWPFGRYERQTRRKQMKDWHGPSVLFANRIIDVLVRAGHNNPGITHNSVLVRVVHSALIRMKFPNPEMITRSAIGMHLTRWDEEFGLNSRLLT